MLRMKRISSSPEDSGIRLSWLSQKSKKLKLSYVSSDYTKTVGRVASSKLNWPMQCRNSVFCLLKKRCLASRRELYFSLVRRRCLFIAQTSQTVSSPLILEIYITLPSCHMPSMQKSTLSPTSRSGSMQRFKSFSMKAYLLFQNSSCSSSPSRSAIFSTISRMSFDSLKDQQSRSLRQREHAGLCFKASSRQGRQKACPQSVIIGQIMRSRQTGQLNFSGLAMEMQSSLLKSTFLLPFPSLCSPCILAATRSRNSCLLIFGLATKALRFLGTGCSSKVGWGSCACRRVFTILRCEINIEEERWQQIYEGARRTIIQTWPTLAASIDCYRNGRSRAVRLLQYYCSQSKSVIMNHQQTRGNRFRAKHSNSPLISSRIAQQAIEACSQDVCKGALTPHSSTRTKDKHALTVRHQNVEHCRESTSLSTQYRVTVNQAKMPDERLPSNTQKENCLSPKSARMTSKHKINYSILQRIHRALELYPNIAKERNPIANLPNFATQSQEEYEPEGLINLSKLVLWRESKLLKTMERVYDSLGEDRDEKMKGQKRGSTRCEGSVQRGLKHYLMLRHKTDKLCRENFINLCYSLYYYFDKAHYQHRLANSQQSQGKLLRLTTFQQFLHLQHSDSHLTFYLYSRTLLISVRQDEGDCVSLQQLKEFLALLSHGDAVLYQYYKDYLTKRLERHHQYQNHQILHLLLHNFQRKRSSTSLLYNPTTSDIKEGNEASTASLLGVAYDCEFWKTDPPPQENMQEELYERLLEEIGRQTKKLMSYFQVESGRHRDTVSELVLIKAIRMLNAAHGLDKYRWFKQLQLVKERVLLAKSSDFAELDALHHDLHDILQSHLHCRLDTSKVLDFAKKLLTTRAFVDKLQQLFELFGQ